MRNYSYISIISDPYISLGDWKKLIQELIDKHGENTIMYTDGGYNNVELYLEKQESKK